MPLETGDFICDLVETNPPGTDPVSQGDDHIKLLKHVLLTQFPNLCGEAVTATAEQLNSAGKSQMPITTVYTTVAAAQTHTFGLDRSWYKITITGGGGGGKSASEQSASGGYSGGTVIKTAAITEATATYSVGAGGGVNNAGGDSSWDEGVAVNLLAGGGGTGTEINTPGSPGIASGGDININGTSEVDGGHAVGGATIWGAGSRYASLAGAYGAGGAGENLSGTTPDFATAGESGIIVIEEY